MSGAWGDDIGNDEDETPPPLRYATLDRFVGEYLVFIYRRVAAQGPTKGVRWCPQWYYHEEAIARLEAMWRSWELSRLDAGAGMSNWFLSHGDPHMRVLFSEDGPFQFCKNEHGDRFDAQMPQLKVVTPPEGLFRP